MKAAVKLFENPDTTMSALRKFEEKAVQTGCHSIIKDAEKYSSELHLTLTLQHPNPRATTEDGDEIGGKRPLLPRHSRKIVVTHWEKRNVCG